MQWGGPRSVIPHSWGVELVVKTQKELVELCHMLSVPSAPPVVQMLQSQVMMEVTRVLTWSATRHMTDLITD